MQSSIPDRFRPKPRTLLIFAAMTLLARVCSAQASVRLDLLPQSWLDDQGHALKLAELRGQRVILTMAYASCHYICPMTIEGLKRVQAALDARGELASIVVVGYDPQHDKPRTWRDYRLIHRLNRDNWHFLSGSPQATEQLAHQLGFDFWRYDEHVMHDAHAIVFDADGVLQSSLGPATARWPDAL